MIQGKRELGIWWFVIMYYAYTLWEDLRGCGYFPLYYVPHEYKNLSIFWGWGQKLHHCVMEAPQHTDFHCGGIHVDGYLRQFGKQGGGQALHL